MTPQTQSEPSAGAPRRRGLACAVPVTIRFLTGLAFFIFGLNGFIHFIPEPKQAMPEGAAAFAGALMKTGYMFQFIAGTQLVVGALLLLNIFVPLALVLIMPVLLNIIAFHLFLQPAGFAPGLILTAFVLYLAWVYRSAYGPVLKMRNRIC